MTNNLNNYLFVAVSLRISQENSHNEIRDSVDRKLLDWLIFCGFLPIPIPNSLFDLRASSGGLLEKWLNKITPSAIVLSGGGDIGDHPLRDEVEKYILTWAQEKHVPVLGICRGAQMMGVWAGAELKRVVNHVNTVHKISLIDPVSLEDLLVNSFHNWALDRCPNHFKVIAMAEDGVIEGIKHNQLPWEGWMWHPERDAIFTESNRLRIKRLFHHD